MKRRGFLAAMAAAGASPSLFPYNTLAFAQTGATNTGGDLTDWSLAAASDAIRRGEVTCRDLSLACLRRIEAQNPKINAMITVAEEQALDQAAVLDAEAKAGKYRSALHGIPIALKDNIDTAGIRTTNASALFKDRIPEKDARVVQLLKQAGAVIIAKASLGEFAVTPTNVTSHFGPVRNPRNTDYVSGGSSGGSAAAVAANMCYGALGTDSGGSVRLPSAWCGTVGLKPTLGLVPFSGIGPGIPILDTCGPIGRTVADVALLLEHMVGYDPMDVMSVERPRENYAASVNRPVDDLRVGVLRRPFFDDVDAQVATAVEAAISAIAPLVKSVRDVSLKGLNIPEGMFTAADIYGFHQKYFPGQRDAYQPATRKILDAIGGYFNDPETGSTAQKLSEHVETQKSIIRGQRTIDAEFDDFDVVVLPTMKSLPPTVEAARAAEYGPGPNNPGFLTIDNTLPFNVAGLPALSIPCGVSKEGLPIGLMIGGPHFSETTLLALAAAYERSVPTIRRGAS